MKNVMLIACLLALPALSDEPIPRDSDKAMFTALYALSLTGTTEGSGEQENLSMHGVAPAVAKKLEDHMKAAIKDINALAAANQVAVCKAEDVETLAALLDKLDADTDARMEKAVHDLPLVFGPEDAARLSAAASEVHMAGMTGHGSEGIRSGNVSLEEYQARACHRQAAHGKSP